MEFRSAYAHWLRPVRRAPSRSRPRRPAANAEAVLALTRECHDEAVALSVFPVPDRLLARGPLPPGPPPRRRHGRGRHRHRGLPTCSPSLVVGAPLRHGNRIFNCAIVIHRGEIPGSRPRPGRPIASSMRSGTFAAGDDQRGGIITIGRAEVPFGTDLIFTATDTGLDLHVEVCGYVGPDPRAPRPPS